MKRALRFWPAHPVWGALTAVAIAIALTIVLSATQTRGADSGGDRAGSEYDRYFSHEQLGTVERLAMCEALLNLTRPQDESERMKERLAIEEAYIRGVRGGESDEWEYRRRARDKYEVAQAIRLADELYQQANCR